MDKRIYYKIIDTKIISNFQLDTFFCPCPLGSEVHSLRECPRFGQKIYEEPKTTIVITAQDNETEKVVIAECEVSKTIWTEPMYKITEYWPNYFEKSDEPRIAYVKSLSTEELSKIDWLNKSQHGWRLDGMFIKQSDSEIIIAMIRKIKDG